MTMKSVDLVMFSCEGRGPLLARTLESFRASVSYPFAQRILAIDGPMPAEQMRAAAPDVLIQSPQRRGYVRSILRALRLVQAEYVFWLEDDFLFPSVVDVGRMAGLLEGHPGWGQVMLSRWGPMTDFPGATMLDEGIYDAPYSFSCTPCVCRAADLRRAFEYIEHDCARAARVGFEDVLREWYPAQGLVCATLDQAVEHVGMIESTPRQWHMLASLDGQVSEYVHAMAGPPAYWRRFTMLGKLAARSATLGARQLVSDAAYETAFRIISLPIPRDASRTRRQSKPSARLRAS